MTEVAAASALSTDTPASSRFAWRLAPVAVAVGSLGLYAVALGHRSLSSDEASSLEQSRGSWADVLSTIVHDNPVQASHLVLLRLARSFGDSELVIRTPAAIAVALAAGLLVILGTLFLGRIGGLVAGVAFALNAGVFEAARVARPTALGLLGIVLATLLFVIALERGGGWRWWPYAVVAAVLPLTHPLAASVLAAHGVTLIVQRDRRDLRAAGIALVTGIAGAAIVLGWMVNDRLDAVDTARRLDLAELAHGVTRALGWNPILGVAAVAGIVLLFRAPASRTWGTLVTGLIAAPLVAILLAAVVVPVYVTPLVLSAPGLALAAGAVAPVLAQSRGLVWAGLAAVLMWSAVVVSVRVTREPAEDWRAVAVAVRQVRGPRETVVVLPERSRAAFSYYAPYVALSGSARGDGAWIAVVASSPEVAISSARPVVRTPTYALLRQFRYGSDLRLQHWVRP